MKKNEKIFISILIAITVIVIIIFIANSNKKEEKGEIADKEINEVIDVTDEYYAGKNIYKENGDIIIEGDEGSKTIISNKKDYETDLKEATQETKEKYELQDVKVELVGNMTKVSGKLKSNQSGKHKVSIQTKFYKADGKVAGTISAKIDSISSGETKNFSASIMGDYTQYTNKTEVEFTN